MQRYCLLAYTRALWLLGIGFACSISAHACLILNEDNSHFFVSRTPEEMTLEGLQAFIDQYAQTKVTHLFLCPNAMKASYRSNVWDAIWDMAPNQRVKEDESADGARRWIKNAKLLYERGLDPYTIWIERCRHHGISPWLSMRMNDVHGVDDPTSYLHSRFWIDHPEYWRVPGGTRWIDRAFNYAIPEVREHHLKFIKELLERYDPDGLELDWMRFGYHFPPGKEEAGCLILTEFMREVRDLTLHWSKQRGHPIQLGARVPTLPESAKGLGMDAITWVREGLVDMLVPTPFWATADFDIPLEAWRIEIKKQAPEKSSSLIIAAGLEILLRAYPGAPAIETNLDAVRGFASASLFRGVDCIYLFNFLDPAPMRGGVSAYRELLEKGLSLPSVADAKRSYPVTYRDTVPPGVPDGVVLPACPVDSPEFTLFIAPAPEEGEVILILGFAAHPEVAKTEVLATLNGYTCQQTVDCPFVEKLPGVARALAFQVESKKVSTGYNKVRVICSSACEEQKIVWVELRISP